MPTARTSTRSRSTRATTSTRRCSTTAASCSAAGTTRRGHDEITSTRCAPTAAASSCSTARTATTTGTDGSTVQFLDPRPMPDGRLLALRAAVRRAPMRGGDLLDIDVANYVENMQPTLPNRGMLSGPAQQPATVERRHDHPRARRRAAASAPPIRCDDGTGRLLVSWTQCRLLEGGRIVPCTPTASRPARRRSRAAALWRLDVRPARAHAAAGRRRPSEGIDVSPTSSRCSRARCRRCSSTASPASTSTPSSPAEGVGILDIRSVYDFDGVDTRRARHRHAADPRRPRPAQRPARFLRIEKAVSLPDRDVRDFASSAFGVSAAYGMREILGYAPIEPDGSVRVKVPANVAFAITVLDANGRRIGPRHHNWLQVRPGEELSCNGCHDPGERPARTAARTCSPPPTPARRPPACRSRTRTGTVRRRGETMAQVRARISCQTDCAALLPSIDLVLRGRLDRPVAAGRAGRASVRVSATPTSARPPRPAPTAQRLARGLPHHDPLRDAHPPAVGQAARDARCRWRHGRSPTTPARAATRPNGGRCAAGTRRVSSTSRTAPSADEPDQFNAYRELLFGRQRAGTGQRRAAGPPGADRSGPGHGPAAVRARAGAAFAAAPAVRAASCGSSHCSPPGGSHAGCLTPAELRLVSEWVDSAHSTSTTRSPRRWTETMPRTAARLRAPDLHAGR